MALHYEGILRYIENDNIDILELLYEKNEDFTNYYEDDLGVKTSFLHYAAMCGSEKALKFFIEKRNIDINEPDILDMTPLDWALAHDHVHIVKYLIEQGKPSLSKKNKLGTTTGQALVSKICNKSYIHDKKKANMTTEEIWRMYKLIYNSVITRPWKEEDLITEDATPKEKIELLPVNPDKSKDPEIEPSKPVQQKVIPVEDLNHQVSDKPKIDNLSMKDKIRKFVIRFKTPLKVLSFILITIGVTLVSYSVSYLVTYNMLDFFDTQKQNDNLLNSVNINKITLASNARENLNKINQTPVVKTR